MLFEWDEAKRKAGLQKHGVDILYAAQMFEGQVLTRLDDRHDDGEQRWISLGRVDDEMFVVVYTERQGVKRLITAWKGGPDEKASYEAGIAQRPQDNAG